MSTPQDDRDSRSSQDHFGIMLLSTIALLDVAKAKLHPQVDLVNMLSLTGGDVEELLGLYDTERRLVRMRRKTLGELREVPTLLRNIADTMDDCLDNLGQSLESEDPSSTASTSPNSTRSTNRENTNE